MFNKLKIDFSVFTQNVTYVYIPFLSVCGVLLAGVELAHFPSRTQEVTSLTFTFCSY
jgi:hypothetical protein